MLTTTEHDASESEGFDVHVHRTKLSAKAIELRRRVELRRAERKAALVKAGEMIVYNEKRAIAKTLATHTAVQGAEMLWGAEILQDHHLLYARSEQQFAIRRGQDYLARDLRRSIVGAREHREKLKNLEERVRKMRADVNGVERNHADADVDKLEKESRDDARQLGLKDLFATCDKCRARVLRSALDGHRLVCAGAPFETHESSDEEAVYDPKVERIACVVCGSLKTTDKHRAHVERCKVRQRYTQDAKQAKQSVAMKPQAPRDLRIGRITATSIELKWAPPILDGGSTVYEYEVLYSKTTVARIGKKVTKHVARQDPVATTRFLYVEPVAEYGFTLTELRASTEYSEFTARCKNSIGWSEYCDPLMAYETKAAIAPGKPLYLEAGAPTSKSIPLRWCPPLRDGGSDIVDYAIHYVEVRHLTHNEWMAEFRKDDGKGARGPAKAKKPAAGAATEEKHEIKTPVDLRVGSAANEFVLRDLRGETDYVNIEVRARNASGHEGISERIAKVTTMPPSMREMLQKELQRATSVDGEFVDTDFYQGFLQRELKKDYVARLRADLAEAYAIEKDAVVRDEASQEQAKKRWAAGRSTVASARMFAMTDEPEEEDEETRMVKAVPEYKRKRTQFEHRLKQLEIGIKKAEAEQLSCFADRAALTRAMATQQERILEVRAEIDRVSTVKAPYINSSVIHGSVQRFTKPQLQRDLQIEMEKCLGEIADSKRKVQILDKNRVRAAKTVETKKQELADRRSQFVNVRADVRRQTHVARARATKVVLSKEEIAAGNAVLCLTYLELWAEYRDDRRHARRVALACLTGCARRYCRAAFYRIQHGHFQVFEAVARRKGAIVGKGGRLLKLSLERREENISDARAALKELSELRGGMDQLAYSRSQLKVWQEGNRYAFESSELHATVGAEQVTTYAADGHASTDAEPDEIIQLLEGDGFRRMQRYDDALRCYNICVDAIFERAKSRANKQVDVAALARAQIRIGRALYEQTKYTKAITAYDRASELIRELSTALDHSFQADAKAGDGDAAAVLLEREPNPKKARCVCVGLRGHLELGLGQTLVESAEYKQGQTQLEKARETFAILGDVRMKAVVSRALAECARRQHLRADVVGGLDADAERVEGEVRLRLKGGGAVLARLKERLFSTSAKQGKITKLYRQSARALRLVINQQAMRKKIDGSAADRLEQVKTTAKVEELRDRIEKQLNEAKTSDKDEMSSTLVHGREQIFEIEELKVRLAERLSAVSAEVEKSKADEKAIDTRVDNYEDDIRVAQEEYDIEAGALMLSVLQKSKLRFIAFNPANAAGNETMGSASGGVCMCVAAEGRSISVFNLKTGVLRRVFTGDEEGRHLGEPEGHTSLVSALHFSGERVYSGGMDCRIFVWDVSEASLSKSLSDDLTRKDETTEEQRRGMAGRPVMCLEGHEATVTAVAVDSLKVVSGGADCKLMLWARHTGERLRILHGHARSVLCLNIGPTWMVSGGQESEARIWALPSEADPSAAVGHERSRIRAQDALKRSKEVRCRKRLAADGVGINVIKYGTLELIAGLADGHIVVWWLQTGEVLQRSKAHNGPVFDLQFDATRVVSAGGDALVVVTDVTTGEQIQSLRGHEGPVLQLQFDTTKILSAGTDNTLRQWMWATDADRGKSADKYHVYDAGDTLVVIARKYNVTIPDLVRWNAIEDVRKLYAGTRLIVAPGDPSAPTEPERAAAKRAEQKKRRNAEVADEAKQREGSAAKNDAVLKKLAAREKADKFGDADGPKMSLRDRKYVDKASISSRLAVATENTSLDLDATRLRRAQNDPARAAKKNALGTRIHKAIEDSIDPFGEVAAARQKVLDDARLAREKSEREEALAQAPSGGGGGPARGKLSAPLLTRAEKRVEASAIFVLEQVVLPALLLEETYTLAEEGLKKMTWQESLAGRLNESIEDGPMDYDALELLLAQERMKAARRHAAQVRADLEKAATNDRAAQAALSLGGIAMASIATPAVANRHPEKPTEEDDMWSQPDSQADIETVVSSEY